VHRIGVQVGEIRDQQRARRAWQAGLLADMRATGMTQNEMAEKTGMSLDKVRELLYDPTGERRRGRQRRYAAKRRAQAKEID
jgi:hypothetical protein